MPATLQHIYPVFLVADIKQAAEYYRDVLGFRFDRYWGEPPCFAMCLRDGAEVFLREAAKPEQVRPNGRVVCDTWDAYLRVDDVGSLYAEFKSKGAKILRGPETAFYDMREIEVQDINGYVLCFGQDVESPSPQP